MNVARQKRFGAVEAFELGYGPLGPPLMTVHFYLLEGTVIDTGQRHMQRAALQMLADKPVAQVLLTHHHEDHSGNAAAIARARGVPVYGHPVAAEKLRGGFPIKPYQHWVWGSAEPAAVAPLPEGLAAGRLRLLPIHCPGHSRDHLAFLVPDEGWLFAGDLFLGERIKYFRADEVFGDQLASLRKVLAHDFEALFCAHRPCPEGGRQKLAAKLQFLEDLHGEVQRLKSAGRSADETVAALDRRRDRLIRLITMGNVSFANMVRSAYAA